MKPNYLDDCVHMMTLGSNRSISSDRKVLINKFTTRIFKKARTQAKQTTCLICGKECSSFCNSHSVPQFVLENIAEQGNVCIPLQGELPTTGKNTGIKKAGTFHIICSDCDNTIFSQYENPTAYNDAPSDIMMAQMSIKNYIQMIDKRRVEAELHELFEQRLENYTILSGAGKTIEELDLLEYQSKLDYAVKALSGNNAPRYYLRYFRILDYVVPYAVQSTIPLIVDLEENLINNKYNLSEKYKLEYLQVAVFPLKTTSAVILFTEQDSKRYRRFFRQLKKLENIDQLAVINYLVFCYTENVFINPSVYHTVWENANFREACKKTSVAISTMGVVDPLKCAMQSYSFSCRHDIPNLLSFDFSLKKPDEKEV